MSSLPSWREHAPAICVPATRDEFVFLTRRKRYKLPMTPPQMVNHGNFIISLGQLIPILGTEAEKLGVDVFAGFAAAEALFDESGAVKGVRIGDMGVEKNGEPGPNFALGPEIHAKVTMFCEGCRGSTSKQLIKPLQARRRQVAANLWPGIQGAVAAAAGARTARPHSTHCGMAARQPHLRRQLSLSPGQRSRVCRIRRRPGLRGPSPQTLRGFPAIQESPLGQDALLQGGEIIAGGARTVIEGGYQSMPTLEMPGAMLVGDAGGTLNTPKIKGIHQAIRSGMTAAAHYVETGTQRRLRPALARIGRRAGTLQGAQYPAGISPRPVVRARQCARWKPSTFGKLPWTLANHADDKALKRLDEYVSPDRGWGDRELPPRDRLAFVFFAATTHDENQPVHLHVADTDAVRDALHQGFRQSLHQFLSGQRLRNDRRRQRRQETADQCLELRALQGLRHQGTLRRIRSPGSRPRAVPVPTTRAFSLDVQPSPRRSADAPGDGSGRRPAANSTPAQEEAAVRLDRWSRASAARAARSAAMTARALALGCRERGPRLPPRGLYLWGGVGRGKTLLMDCFFASLGPVPGERTHFYRFMRRRARRARPHQGPREPLEAVAQRMAAARARAFAWTNSSSRTSPMP